MSPKQAAISSSLHQNQKNVSAYSPSTTVLTDIGSAGSTSAHKPNYMQNYTPASQQSLTQRFLIHDESKFKYLFYYLD